MSILKKSVLFVLAGMLILAQGLRADEPPYAEDNPASKLGRGIVNVISSPGEYVLQTKKLMETNDPRTAYFGGILQGTCHMIKRIGGGIYEVVTFPIPIPKKYKPLMDPPTTFAGIQDSGLLQAN